MTITTTTLRLDPGVLRVWRSPHSVQYGIDEPVVVIDSLELGHEKLLDTLSIGTGLAGLRALGSHYGLTHRDIDDLLQQLRPVLETYDADVAPTPPPVRRVTVVGASPTADEVARLLTSAGVTVARPAYPTASHAARTDLGIIVDHFAIRPELHSTWLRHDIPHLPVVWSDRGVRIGPVVEPGRSACLHCLERHRTDLNPAWPTIASQLLDQRSRLETPLLAADAAAVATWLALTRLSDGPGSSVATRIDTHGERSRERFEKHPECGCHGLDTIVAFTPERRRQRPATPAAARRETATARARRAATRATTTRAVADEPA